MIDTAEPTTRKTTAVQLTPHDIGKEILVEAGGATLSGVLDGYRIDVEPVNADWPTWGQRIRRQHQQTVRLKLSGLASGFEVPGDATAYLADRGQPESVWPYGPSDQIVTVEQIEAEVAQMEGARVFIFAPNHTIGRVRLASLTSQAESRNRKFTLRLVNGDEQLRYGDNGARVRIVSWRERHGFRGLSADLILVAAGQNIDPEHRDALFPVLVTGELSHNRIRRVSF